MSQEIFKGEDTTTRTEFLENSSQAKLEAVLCTGLGIQHHSGLTLQTVHMCVGVLNINISLAFISIFHSKGIFYSSHFSPSSPECSEVHPRKKIETGRCVSLGGFSELIRIVESPIGVCIFLHYSIRVGVNIS